MTTVRRMPALSPEDIRKISKNAVATVAAEKIVTNKTAFVNAAVAGVIASKRTEISRKGDRQTVRKVAAASTRDAKASSLTRQLAMSVLSQSGGREYIQESFNQVRKNKKA
ncbi:hypothetical protein ICL29_004108 [Salmonella enterica]|nr:hypothetical protein [Salmonella enterica]EHK5999384.1 hypothetical protein [Salmonella enterica]EIF5124603.1 hypothetical protein [Salmonella enterica]EIF5348779.1 hypothetical protein [Salmonella enterica]EIF5657376.1 hypothetical protein [Salmonella enterica]